MAFKLHDIVAIEATDRPKERLAIPKVTFLPRCIFLEGVIFQASEGVENKY